MRTKTSKVTELEQRLNDLASRVEELSKKPYEPIRVSDDILLKKKLLLPREVASILRCGLKSVYRMVKRGTLDADTECGVKITSASVLEKLEKATY